MLGYPLKAYDPAYDGPELFLSPLAFCCSVCGVVTEIIDTAVHGYDAECVKREGGATVTRRGSGDRTTFACPGCGSKSFAVSTFFAHSHFDLIEDEPELEPRAQDYFDSFDCHARCVSCGKVTSVASYELA